MIIREKDKEGRISFSMSLLRLANIKTKNHVALCMLDSSRIMIRELENTKDCKVFATAYLDEKGRIVIPKKVWDNNFQFITYSLNGDLIIEKAH